MERLNLDIRTGFCGMGRKKPNGTVEIGGGKFDLDRKLIAPNGQIVCHCDGTSREVRACLADITQWSESNFFALPMDATDNKAHLSAIRGCAKSGIKKLDEIFKDV